MKERLIIPLQASAPRRPPAPDLLTVPGIGRFLRWRYARATLQLPLFAIAVLMIWDGLSGSDLAPKNLATVLTWIHYRGLVVLALLAAGNLFCMACPFMFVRNLARRVFRPVRRWPKWLRNKWLAIALLGLFFFAYELFDLWATPWWTAWLILAYFAAALIVDSVFTGAPFCKYVCPIGQFNFVSALVSPLEIRVRDSHACADCRTKDCIKGHAGQVGCELWLFQERKVGNLDCTFCLDCIHACPHNNIGMIARLPASELWVDPRRAGIGRFSQRPDLAALIAIFTFGALINAFGMVGPAYVLEAWLAGVLGARSEAPLLGLIFFGGLVLEPLALLGLAGWLTRRALGRREALLRVITRYAYALVPVGFGVWLAHYAFHFLTGFWAFVPRLQNLLADLGLPLLGRGHWAITPILPIGWLLPIEWGFMGLGCFGALVVAYQIAQRDAPERPWRASMPWMGLAILLTLIGFWLMSLPMDMRGVVLPG